jgi:hypothetical protein
MAIPKDQKLYAKVKKMADKIYEKPSAYKSGYIVKKYSELGGQYIDDGKEKKLERWFEKEKWMDINPNKTKTSYPVFRPTVRVNKNTPLLVSEIDPKQLKEQIKLKQKIKGSRNLPKFEKKK